MFPGPLHNKGADGLCEWCQEPFPCRDGLAIYDAVKRDLGERAPVEREQFDRLLKVYYILAPVCAACGRWLSADDVLAIEAPDEHGRWLHPACRQQPLERA